MDSETLSKSKNVLVFRIGHLGDTIVALPAFWALRSYLPNSKLTLLSNSDPRNPQYISATEVLPQDGLFDEWLSYPVISNPIRNKFKKLKLLSDLRRRNFDAMFYLVTRNRTEQQIDRDTRFFRAAGIKTILGIKHLSDGLLPFPIPVPTPETVSETDFLLETLRSEGIPIGPDIDRGLALTAEERSHAENWLTSRPNWNGKSLIAVAPGSKWSSKVWSEKKFEQVIAQIIIDYGAFPIVFGGPEDRAIGERLVDQWGTGAVAAGELSVRQAAALLERCRLYVGNDTGTMHLAGAVGVPCVAIFAAIDWIGRWKPLGDRNHLIRKRVDCEGCHQPVCPFNNKCLELVTVDEVYRACCETLEHSTAAATI